MKDLVSILIPCYNGENFLDRCFECLLKQTYKNIEIIIVNDGSTDNSENIILKYREDIEKKGFNFLYIYQENGGAASAINTALKHVNGEFIMLYDVDDIIFEDAVKEKAEFLINNLDYDMVRNNGYYVDNSDINKINGLFSNGENIEKENIFEDLILGRANNWPGSFMVRTESLFSHIKYREIYISQFGQNLQIMLPVAYFGKTGYINKPLMKYIRHENSHSACTSYEKKLKLMNGYEENRIEIIKQLAIKKQEKEKYINEVEILYCRIRMEIAYQTKDIELFIGEYKKLKKAGVYNKQDKILYYRIKNNIYDRFYFLLHRLSKVKVRLKTIQQGVIFRKIKTKVRYKCNELYYNIKDCIIKKVFKVKIKDIDESIDYLINHRVSLARFGDGEFKIINSKKIGFQEINNVLANRLREVLNSTEEGIMICIPGTFLKTDDMVYGSKIYWDNYLKENRMELYKSLNLKKVYYNTQMTRLYIDYKDKSKVENRFEKLKSIWANKDIVIVEGEFSKLGVGNDLFRGANSISRIICPSRNAFNKYDEILEAIKKVDKDKLILIALGPTATVLAYDLHLLGYQALDIGHIDIEYEWFLRKATEKVAIENKYVNEVLEGRITESENNEEYLKEILFQIKD